MLVRRSNYFLTTHATADSTALTITIVTIGIKTFTPGRSMTMSPGK
jgi:hypothetical protein